MCLVCSDSSGSKKLNCQNKKSSGIKTKMFMEVPDIFNLFVLRGFFEVSSSTTNCGRCFMRVPDVFNLFYLRGIFFFLQV